MDLLLIIDGISRGSLYGLLALALVLVYRATDNINFAQGAIATCSVVLAWYLLQRTPPYIAVPAALLASFCLGAGLYRMFFHRLDESNSFTPVIISIGVAGILESVVLYAFGTTPKPFPSPFGEGALMIGDVALPRAALGNLAVLSVVAIVLVVLFRFTTLGLQLRATAQNGLAARLLGIRARLMIGVGWGLAAVLGAVAGLLIAPTLFLTFNMMQSILVYAFIAAVLGGLNSPVGAILGGILLGVIENVAASYAPIGDDLKTVAMVVLLILMLVLRPYGLLGHRKVRRV